MPEIIVHLHTDLRDSFVLFGKDMTRNRNSPCPQQMPNPRWHLILIPIY